MNGFSPLFAFVQVFVYFGLRLFYKRFRLENRKIIPRNAPVILAPNHQNTLMDAITTGHLIPNQTNFLTRADIFENGAFAKIMYWLKMLPVFRIRDGVESLQKNEEIFRSCVKKLSLRENIIIFPEAELGYFRRLRPVRKGIMRIAFAAEEENNFSLGVKIVPVGLNYSDFPAFRSDAYVIFGQPIELKDYIEEYNINPPKAMLKVMEELAIRLRKLIIHIESEKYYETYEIIRVMYRPQMIRHLILDKNRVDHHFRAEKRIVAILDMVNKQQPELLAKLDEKVQAYHSLLTTHKVDDQTVACEKSRDFEWSLFIGMLLLSPVWLTGFVLNYLPLKLITKIVKGFQDVRWHSSLKMTLGAYLLPLWLFIIFIVLWVVFGMHPWVWITLVLMPIISFFAMLYKIGFIRSRRRINFLWQVNKGNLDALEIMDIRSQIINQMDDIWYGYTK